METLSFNDAIVAIKEHTVEYLEAKRGVKIKGRYANGTSHAFRCINPSHHDKTPSMFFSYDNHCAICKGCGAKYGIFDLIGEDYGLYNFRDQVKKGAELYGIQIEEDDTARQTKTKKGFSKMDGLNQDKNVQPTDTATHTHTHTDTDKHDYTQYYDECKRRISETDYHRGLSAETLDRYWVGYDPDFKTRDADTDAFTRWRALIIPTGKFSYTVRNTDQNATKKNRYRNIGSAHIFSAKTLQTAQKPIIIVEGEIDAMSIAEVGGEAVGLGSLYNIPQLVKMLEAKKPSQPLIIALDQEAEPEKQRNVDAKEKELTDGLERLHIPYYKLRPFAGYHDANEALMRDREAFTEAVARAEDIEQQAEEEEKNEHLSMTAGANLQQFVDGITDSVNTPCLSTGFSSLDSVLDGGLYEGLITIGAISSLGKTSLALQIADQVAAAGNDVLIFSLEMARAELMSKSISRHTLQIALDQKIDTRNAKTARGITDGQRYLNYNQKELKLIQDAISEYGKYADRLFIKEGVGDIGTEHIRQTIEKHIRFTGRRPLVIVDYLQIVSPYSDRATDKQVVDHCVLELKRMSRDHKIPVIAISSFNRAGYKQEATFEQLKESGAIEYGSDIVIGLQLKGAGGSNFDPTEAKKKNPRQVELVLLKNRQGKVGDKILFDYYPQFNYFVDKGVS